MGTYFFKIPDNEVATLIVELLPGVWKWADGRLDAPEALISKGKVAANAGYVMRREQTEPSLDGFNEDEYPLLMLGKKLPRYLFLNQAGQNTLSLVSSIHRVQPVVTAFLRKGYTGHITFFTGSEGTAEGSAATCSLHFRPWCAGTTGIETGDQPARIKLTYFCSDEKGIEVLGPTLGSIRLLGLEQYTPVSRAA